MLEHHPFGQLIRQNGTLQVFWSPHQWVSPPDALLSQPGEWIQLGTEGWWSDDEQKALFERVKAIAGALFPTQPGEWCDMVEEYKGNNR